jgi:hypothetical protein
MREVLFGEAEVRRGFRSPVTWCLLFDARETNQRTGGAMRRGSLGVPIRKPHPGDEKKQRYQGELEAHPDQPAYDAKEFHVLFTVSYSW